MVSKINALLNYFPILRQLMRFGIVGAAAATVHFSIVICLVEAELLTPLYANVIAFLVGFQVSYWGHRSWTFSGTTTSHSIAMPKLFVVGSTGLAINESLFYFFLTVAQLPYPIALLAVLTITPAVSFTLSKLWVFR